MSLPTDTPSWATGASAAITAPSSGKKALGFVDLEFPRAEHLNYLFNLLSVWISYLAALQVLERFRWVPASSGVLGAGATIDGATSGVTGSNGVNLIPISIAVGDQIDNIGLSFISNGSQQPRFRLLDADGAGNVTVQADFTIAAVTSWTKFTTLDPHLASVTVDNLPVLAVDGHAYWLSVVFVGAGTGEIVQTVGYSTQTV